jgi:hypothetical protein
MAGDMSERCRNSDGPYFIDAEDAGFAAGGGGTGVGVLEWPSRVEAGTTIFDES